MANSLDQIAAINTAEMGPKKAQCVHAVATLIITALLHNEKEREVIIVSTGILASALGIDASQALELLEAGAVDVNRRAA